MRTRRARALLAAALTVALFFGLKIMLGADDSVDRADSTRARPVAWDGADPSDGGGPVPPARRLPTPGALPDASDVGVDRESLRIRGVVTDERAEPIAGAEVFVDEGGSWSSARANLENHGLRTMTASDGKFKLDASLAAGTKTGASIIARRAGYVAGSAGLSAWPAEGGRITLTRGEVLSGRVVDLGGTAIQGARVTARLPHVDSLATDEGSLASAHALHTYSCQTGQSGEFRIEGVPPGARLRVEVSARGFIPAPFGKSELARLDKRGGEVLLKAEDSPAELRMQAAYVALVGVRHKAHDHIAYAGTFLADQFVEYPAQTRPVFSFAGTFAHLLPPRAARALERAIRLHGHSVIPLLITHDKSPGSDHDPLSARTRWTSLGRFRASSRAFEYRRVESDPAWLEPQFLTLEPEGPVGSIRVLAERGPGWTGRPVFLLVPEGGEGATVKFYAILDESGRALLPPVVAGAYDLYQDQINVAQSPHRRIVVRAGETVEASMPVPRDVGSWVTVRAWYSNGLPASRIGMTLKVDGRQIYYKPWPAAFALGSERIPLQFMTLGKSVEVYLERPGYPHGVLRIDSSELAADTSLEVRFPPRLPAR